MNILNKLLATSVTLGITFAAHGAAFAEPMTAAEITAYLNAGKLQFVAGSVGKFSPDGTYSFQHGSSREKGTYVINADGTVAFTKARRNKSDVFYIDAVNGKNTVIYTSGRYAGKKFRLR